MIAIGQSTLSIDDLFELVFKHKKISLSGDALEQVNASYAFLEQFSSDKLIYGINTGLGPMAQYKIEHADLLQLQYNLIRSHASGSGQLMSPIMVKALMIARLNSFMQARSGVHRDVVELLKELINNDITPCIYEHGGVGASGDLIQLAHLALVMIGEGEVLDAGNVVSTQDVFKKYGIKVMPIHIREGLAILNGTSAMTGIGVLNIIRARRLLQWSVLLSAMTNEAVSAYNDHFSYELNIVKHHKGQNKVAAAIRHTLKDSNMIRRREEHLYDPKNIDKNVFEDKVQEYYSLRCVPQILGPIYDTIEYAAEVLENELNSVNDNPVVDHEHGNIYHGGNFHGDYVSLEMDKLKIAITKMSMLSERQLNYLLNNDLNKKFPPFLNLGVLGLNFGMQGMQFTATSTVAESQTLSFPMYLHSIPNNKDNQDIVSMGCNAAILTKKVIDNSFEILSIQLMALLQAADHLDRRKNMSAVTGSLYDDARRIFPKFVDDMPKYKDIQRVKEYLETTDNIPVSI